MKINKFKKVDLMYFLILVLAISVLIFFYSYKKSEHFSKLPNEYGMRFIGEGEDISDYIKSQMGICFNSGNLNKCYREVANVFMDQFSFETILSEFTVGEESMEIFAKCHQVTHYIGRLAYEKEGSVPVLFSKGTAACWGGFYHGVVEGYFISKNISSADPNVLAGEIKMVCGERKDYSSPMAFNECNHGIGHALMFISDLELPQSLKWCDELPENNAWMCYGGVFMENSSSSTNSDHPPKYLKPDDPFYPCNILEKRYQYICYEFQSSYFARISNFDYIKNANLCSQIPKEYQSNCSRFIGSNQVGGQQSPAGMLKVCQSMPNKTIQRDCMTGVVIGLSGRYVDDPSKMIEFCGLVPVEYKNDCWEGIGRGASTWSISKDKLDLVCRTEDLRLFDICRKAYLNTSIN